MNVAYLRMSLDKTGLEAGVTRQDKQTRELADRNGDTLDEVIRDNDRSASALAKPRPGFEELLALVESGVVRRIYVWHPDRLYRSLRDLSRLLDLVDGRGVEIVSLRSGDLDLSTASGRMQAGLAAVIAAHEVELKGERQSAANRDRATKGEAFAGGRRPLGYLADRMTVDPVEAGAIRDAAELILSGGTLAQAARNVSTTLDRRIVPHVLRNVLTGPRVAGFRQYISRGDRRRGVKTATLSEAQWAAILDAETWTNLRAVLLDPSRTVKRPARTGLLSGVLSCDVCGGKLSAGVVRTARTGPDGTALYRCSGSYGCGRNTVTASHVDRIVSEWARRRVARTVAIADRRVELARTSAHDDGPATVETLEARLVAMAAMWGEGGLSDEEYAAARTPVAAKLAAAREAGASRVKRRAADKLVADAAADWDGLGMDKQRAVIRHLLANADAVIVVAPGVKGKPFDPARVAFRKPDRAEDVA